MPREAPRVMACEIEVKLQPKHDIFLLQSLMSAELEHGKLEIGQSSAPTSFYVRYRGRVVTIDMQSLAQAAREVIDTEEDQAPEEAEGDE